MINSSLYMGYVYAAQPPIEGGPPPQEPDRRALVLFDGQNKSRE
jgi:hypothetical protein